MLLAVLLIVSFLLGVWIYWRHKNRRLLEMSAKIPGPPTVPLLGNALSFMCQPEEMIKIIKKLIDDYGSVLRFWLGADLNIVVSNPDDIKSENAKLVGLKSTNTIGLVDSRNIRKMYTSCVKVLLPNNKISIKGPQYKYMVDYIGVGILSGSGSKWRKHRKIVTPNYGKRAVESYNEVTNQEADILVENLRNIDKSDEIDIYKHIVKTTSYIVCQSIMGLSRDETLQIPRLQNVVDTSPGLYDVIFNRMTKWYLQIDLIYWLTELYQQQKAIMRDVNELCTFIINNRRKVLANTGSIDLELLNTEQDSKSNTKLTVVDRLILSNELSNQELIDETFTLFTSSQEASAKIASFLVLMMAYHPKCQDKVYSEIMNVIGTKRRLICDDDLKQMPYLEKVFKEVIRLFPIGVMLQRTVQEDIEISTCTLPAGSSLVIPIYHIHRDSRFWEDPEAFDPERFSTKKMNKRHAFCYIPFSLGPMDCLGRFFATKLIKTIAIKVLQEFKLSSLRDYKDLRIIMAISAKSADGYHVILTPRNSVL